MANAGLNAAAPSTPPNPFYWSSNDYQQREISITIPWDVETGELLAGTAVRHADCEYKKIYFGVGEDGNPAGGRVINVASGEQNISAGQLHAAGLDTITDIVSAQVTAGP